MALLHLNPLQLRASSRVFHIPIYSLNAQISLFPSLHKNRVFGHLTETKSSILPSTSNSFSSSYILGRSHIGEALPTCFRSLLSRNSRSAFIVMRSGTYTTQNEVKDQDVERLVQHLLLPESKLDLLIELQKSLAQEETELSDLATEHSVCPSNESGGMIGWVARGATVPEFEEAAFNAPLNQIVRVKTKYGWHLIQALAERKATTLKQINVEDFAQVLNEAPSLDDLQLIDVRERNEIEISSIKGFKAYPLSEFGQWVGKITEEFDLSKETYVLCHHGVRSQQAAEWLRTQGFLTLYNINGGIDAYARKVDSSIPIY